MAKTPALINK